MAELDEVARDHQGDREKAPGIDMRKAVAVLHEEKACEKAIMLMKKTYYWLKIGIKTTSHPEDGAHHIVVLNIMDERRPDRPMKAGLAGRGNLFSGTIDEAALAGTSAQARRAQSLQRGGCAGGRREGDPVLVCRAVRERIDGLGGRDAEPPVWVATCRRLLP